MKFMNQPTIVVEEYIQAIYALAAHGKMVKAVHLSDKLGSSPSTVHSTLSRMQRDDLILFDEKKNILLSDKGSRLANQLARRHRLVETFLCDHLGIPWQEVHQHAHILEHGLTPLIEEKLYLFLGSPKFCPHGTPFPGEDSALPEKMITLDQVQAGQRFKVILIDESLEDNKELMRYFWEHQIKPQAIHQLSNINIITQSLQLSSPEGETHIPFEVAPKIGVLLL